MLRHVILFVLGFLLLTICSPFEATPQAAALDSAGWNQLLNAKNLFKDEINWIQYKANDNVGIMSEFKDVLKENILEIYQTYKDTFGTHFVTKAQLQQDRLTVFQNNLIQIIEHNLKARNGLYSFEMGVNQFTDLTTAELKEFTGFRYNPEEIEAVRNTTTAKVKIFQNVPSALDWRKTGAISPVKNQANCGSCVTFAASAQLETVYALTTNSDVVELSQQEILDCVEPNKPTCTTGMDPKMAVEYLQKHGDSWLADYPYVGSNSECLANRFKEKREERPFVQSWNLLSEDEEEIKKAVANFGPVTIAIVVTNEIRGYTKGVFDKDCSGELSHAVLIVGYGSEDGKDFWIIRNSWGKSWGEEGYFKLRRNYGGLCGVNRMAIAITVESEN